MKWEYKFVIAAASGFEKRKEDTFAALGADGWELVTHWNGYFIFKRPALAADTEVDNGETDNKAA